MKCEGKICLVTLGENPHPDEKERGHGQSNCVIKCEARAGDHLPVDLALDACVMQDGDGRADIIASPGANSDGKVRVYTAAIGFGGSPPPAMTVQNSAWAISGTYVG